jgi:hypothetical protein
MAESKNGNLKNFIAMVKTEGLMRTSRYNVNMRTPKSITTAPNMRKILLFCSDITIPGVTIATNQIRIHGEIREAPNEKMFDNTNLSFYVDNNMEVKKLFDSWINSIQNPVTRNFNYYDEYVTEIKIDVEDTKDRKRYEVRLFECYPKNVGGISLAHESKEVMKLQVSMNYKNWTSRSFDAPKETKESPWSRFLKMPTINGRELESLPSVPSEYTENFSGYQESFNQLPDTDSMVTSISSYTGRV